MADVVHGNGTLGIPLDSVIGRSTYFVDASAASVDVRCGNGCQKYQEQHPSRSREASGPIQQVGDADTADCEPKPAVALEEMTPPRIR
jgi:hypothetical protein